MGLLASKLKKIINRQIVEIKLRRKQKKEIIVITCRY